VQESEFEAMLALDERHWWYRGRRRVLAAVVHGIPLPPHAQTRVLDAGCGSGRTLDDLARLGDAHGTELNPLGVEAARRRGHEVQEGRVEEIPHGDASFDLVTCLDVIEHTDDDVKSLRELRRVTKPGGHAVITVPAHPRLWSRHDEVNGHRRRYTSRTLRLAASRAGWDIARMTGFNVAYLAPAALVRVSRRAAPDSSSSELALTPPALDRVLELPLRAEAALIASGRDLPPGLSLLAVIR
jgi:SAM-dependent methyltransferase